MHIIVYDVPGSAVVEWVDHVIVTIVLVAIQIRGAAAVAGEVDKEGVMGLGVANEPLHCAHDVRLGRDAHRIALIVGEDDHVLSAVTKALVQEGGHIGDIVDAALECIGLTKVVDADQQRPATAGTCGVLELVIGGRSMAEMLQGLRRWRRQVRRIRARRAWDLIRELNTYEVTMIYHFDEH